jgi:putative DNA primase/helicase
MDKSHDEWLRDIATEEDLGAEAARTEVARLARLDRATYETERRDSARRLKWRTVVLDREVEKLRTREPKADENNADTVETLDPWAYPVDGASLAEEVRTTLRAFVIFAAPGDADLAALWVLGSYLMDEWRLWPRLLITSPTKACGKSTLLEVLEALVHRGLILSNAKPAGVFRAIEAWEPTLLLDEADTWMKQDEELAGILNSGHTRRTARVIRVQDVGGELKPTLFSTWCSMVIAGIGGQRDTLMSRSIIIGLRRKLADETVARLPMDLHERCVRIRRQALRWAKDSRIGIDASEVEPPDCGNDRRRDNFTPLWRIAEALGEPWPGRIAAAYAAQFLGEDDDDEPAQVLILRDVLSIFDQKGAVRLAPNDIIGELSLMEDRPWADWKNGRPITVHGLARLLKAFKVKTTVQKDVGRPVRVYLRKDIEAASLPYTASSGGAGTRNPVTSQQKQEVSPFSTRNPEPEVTSLKQANLLKTRDGYEVTGFSPSLAEWTSRADDATDPDAWA